MTYFDFTNLADLELTDAEIAAVNLIFSKQKVNQAYWQETPQVFIENFVRCLRLAVTMNVVPSAMAAEGIDESGWFSTDSLFGVKATRLQLSQGIGTVSGTMEVVNGRTIPAVGTFFESPSVQNNFGNYYNYVARMKPNSARYIPFDEAGYLTYLQASPAYSTAGNAYIVTMLSIISSNNLAAFDHA